MSKTFFVKQKQTRKIGIGAEGQIHKDFARELTIYEKYNQNRWLFYSYNASGEKRNITTASLLKAKGLKAGQPDYTFYYAKDKIVCILHIEFKAGKNKQSDLQIDYQNKFKGFDNVDYFVCYSVKEAVNVLQNLFLI